MQDEGKTVVDLGDEFIGFGGNQGERLKYVPSGRFHASQMPAKANGPGSVRVMLKRRLMGLVVFVFRAGFSAAPKRSPETASRPSQSAGVPVSSSL